MDKNRHASPLMNFLKERGKTPEGLIAALGVSDRAFYFWTSGQRKPRFSIRQIQRMCDYLECSVHELPTEFGPSQKEES